MATLKQLTTFLAVAETMQMSEAARILYLSQSTVSQTILDLEREFGAELFQRNPRQLTLTPKGMIFREQAQQVVDRYEGLTRAMEKSHETRELRLGATLTIGNTLLTSILCQLRQDHPDIRPYLYVENTRLLEGRILHHEADIGLIEGWGREEVEPEALLQQSFILREQGSGTRDIFESAMRAAQVPIHVAGESVSSTAIMELVAADLGLGVLSRRCVSRAVEEGQLWALSIRGYPMHRYFQVCYPQRRPVTSQMRDFIAAARTVLERA